MNRVTFNEDDGSGRILTVTDMSLDGRALLEFRTVSSEAPLAGWTADPLTALDLCRAICEASGTLPPVMLGHPDLRTITDADGWASIRGLRLRPSAGGGVTFEIGGNSETLADHQARQIAAVAVAMADQPRPRFDRARVEGLAEALRAAGALCSDTPVEKLAEAALLYLAEGTDHG